VNNMALNKEELTRRQATSSDNIILDADTGKVWWITGGKKRWITNEDTLYSFLDEFGLEFYQGVAYVGEQFGNRGILDNVSQGADITAWPEVTEPPPPPPPPDGDGDGDIGNLVRAEGQNEVYAKLDGNYRHISTLDIFNQMASEFGWEFYRDVQVISPEQLAGLSKGSAITAWPEGGQPPPPPDGDGGGGDGGGGGGDGFGPPGTGQPPGYWPYSNVEFPYTPAYTPLPITLGGWDIPGFPEYKGFPEQYPYYQGIGYPPFGEQYPEYQPQEGYPEYQPQEGFPTYQGTQYQPLGGYPTYGGYGDPLLQQGQQTLMDLLGGKGVGIPYEEEQYQRAMGRITEAQRGGLEEISRVAARTGRAESGLTYGPGGQAEQFITEMGKQRAQTAQDFATQTALMQQQAQQYAVPQALQYGGFGAGQEQLMYQSQAAGWLTGQQEYTKAYEAARAKGLDEYSAQQEGWNAMAQQQQLTQQSQERGWQAYAEQEQIAQQSQERAWQAAQEEYTKSYEAARQGGLDEYASQEKAWQAAQVEYQQIYSSIVLASQREYEWKRFATESYIQEKLAGMGIAPQAMGGGDWSSLLGSLILGLLLKKPV